MLFDFTMFLCSQIFFIQSVKDHENSEIPGFYELLKGSMGRMHLNKLYTSKESFYWPESLSVLYRGEEKPEHSLFKKIFTRVEWKKMGDIKDKKVSDGVGDEELKDILLRKYADRNKKVLN